MIIHVRSPNYYRKTYNCLENLSIYYNCTQNFNPDFSKITEFVEFVFYYKNLLEKKVKNVSCVKVEPNLSLLYKIY